MTIVFWRARASFSFAWSCSISMLNLSNVSSSFNKSFSVIATLELMLDFSSRAAFAKSSRPLDSASSALPSQSWACFLSCSARRLSVFFSAITLAVPLRTSTRVSSISWITMRIIFSGFSALSSRELMLELIMSDSLLNMLIVDTSNVPLVSNANKSVGLVSKEQIACQQFIFSNTLI